MHKKYISILLNFVLILSLLPTYVGAESKAENSKESITNNDSKSTRKEVVEERSEFSKTFVSENGTFTKEIYQEPIHQKRNGKWENISEKLISKNDNETLEAEDTKLKTFFPKKLKKNKKIIYKLGKHKLSFSNISATDGKQEFTQNASIRMKNDENKITYENVFSNIDLRHVIFNTEVKEDWIIKQYNGINQFNYTINTDLIANLEKDGSIGFYEDVEKKEKVFMLPSPILEDSNYKQGLGNGVKSNDAHYELSKKGENQYEIKLVVDKEWLESSDRVYPVYVDPSVTINVLGDTFVSSAYPTTNYNKEWDSSQGEYVLKVGKYDSTTGTNYAFMKFSIVGDLKGAVIDSANLKVFVTHSYYATTKTGLWVDRALDQWYANELTWNNKPSSKNITSTTVARDQWATFDVTSTVQGYVDGSYSNYGFKFHTNGNGQTYWKKITAAESKNKAKLVISYHYPNMKNPAVTATQYADGKTTGYVNVSWPSINGAKSYQLQMYDGKGFQTVYTGTATSWTSKSKKIFPKAPYSTSSSYKLDGTGEELPNDPSKFYSVKGGTTTTRKEYGFKVIANYASGNSPASSEVKKAIPSNLIDTPNMPTVKAYAYSETDATNKGRGWLDISWKAVEGATGYKVLIYNGKKQEEFNVGNVNKWSTKGQKIWPTDSEIEQGKYALHKDKTGSELPIDPNPVYVNSYNDGGDYKTLRRYAVRIKAISDLGTTPQSDSQYAYIPLETPKNVTVTGEIVDYANSRGALNVKWSAVKGAGGYIVEIFDGEKYKSFDVGKVTTWNSSGKSLFDDIVNLPADPTKEYESIGAPETLIDKKAYQVRVKAYRYTPATAPPSEAEKMSGYRGLSAASSIQYGTIPMQEELLGLENYFTYGTHQMGNASSSVNVTTGNMVMNITDHSLFTRGILGFDFTRVYNSRSNISSALGKGWTFAGNETIEKKTSSSNIYYFDEDGTRHEFVYNSSSGTFTSPKGMYLTLTKETINGTSGYRLKDKIGFSKLFEQFLSTSDRYRLYAYQDSNNNRIRFKYINNLLTEIAEIDSSDNIIRNVIKITYNSKNLISKTIFKDRWIEYQYNINDQLISTITKANGTSKTLSNSYDYDEDNDQMIEFTDAKGNVNSIEYKDNEIVILTPQSSGAESVLTTYTFDYKNNLYKLSDTEGKTISYKRDTTNNTYAVTDTIYADGTTDKVIYDDNYNVIQTTDSDGNIEKNEYNNNGNLLKNTNKEAKITRYIYDQKNLLLEQTDPTGIKTTYEYDINNNLIKSKVGEEISEYQYDSFGHMTKGIYPNHTFTEIKYTDNTVTEKDAKGYTTSTTYDDYGRIISTTDGEGRTTSYEFDPLITDLIMSVKDGKGNKTSYTYDDNGNLLSITDAKKHQKKYKYNGNDQVIRVELPVSGDQKMTFLSDYNQNGNLMEETKNSGIKQRYIYNENDQLNSIVVNKNNVDEFNVTNKYNINGQLESTILKDIVKNKTLAKQFAYYPSDLLKQYNQGNYQLNYSYYDNETTQDSTQLYNDGTQQRKWKTKYIYTNEGKPENVSMSMNDQSVFQFVYSYDLKNRQNTLNVNDNLYKQVNSLDISNNVQSIKYVKGTDQSPTENYSYEYDRSGNIKKESSSKGETNYEYDQVNQLIKETFSDGTINQYEYDEVGNRTKADINSKINSYKYNEANQIITKNGVSYLYDKDGNLIQDDKYKYYYNALGQLVKVTLINDTIVASYEYDETGLRTKKNVGSKTYEYYYESDNLSLEVVRENNIIKQYRYYQWENDGVALGFILTEQDSSGKWVSQAYHYWTNYRGDVKSILDQSGQEVGYYQYDTYGNILSENGKIAKDNSIRYAGYYYDSETKNYYVKARYYNPTDSNFLSIDPHPGDEDLPISQNGYNYTNNNPVNLVDTDGEANDKPARLIGPGGWPPGGSRGGGSGAKYKGKIPSPKRKVKLSRRVKLLKQVSNQKLRNTIKEMFRSNAKEGDGSLAAAVRLEVKKGVLTGGKPHIKKAKERIKNIEKILRTENLRATERKIANDLLIELKRALNGK